ncbi:MAG TPA: class I SAM-dependent methyltransferase [Vicinamibacterales bacterium]|nr:class I SAM-dependent methyltransferase [Vicinamibacterales bacterium]
MTLNTAIQNWWQRLRGSRAGHPHRSPAPAPATADRSLRDSAPPSVASSMAADVIRPEDVIARYSLEELCETAEEYYRRVPDPLPHMAKPFGAVQEAPEMLENLGLLLSGLQLGKTMTVLDFGAGTCWLSRCLTQLTCQVICVDTSTTALKLGERLFAEYPPICEPLLPPRFLHFDGRTLDLPDASVDRIVCFDAFHHIPNQAEVLAQLGRVLRPGGIAGFSEPGREHSRHPQAQYEMRNHKVLENDVDLNAIFRLAQHAGFTAMRVKLLNDTEVPLDAYNSLFSGEPDDALRAQLWRDTRHATFNRSIFFLHKGDSRPDSRGHAGLRHSLRIVTHARLSDSGQLLRVDIVLSNTGSATWLHTASGIHGVVRLGTHLYEADGRLIAIDHSRYFLPCSVEPGAEIAMTVDVPLPDSRPYRVTFDLVAEGVAWFENAGSAPVTIAVPPGH